MKVLIAADGSNHSLAALNAFLSRRAWFRDVPAVELVHVHAPIPYPRAAAWAGKEAVDRYYDEESELALKPAEAILTRQGVPFRPVKLVGDAAREIIGHAAASDCDLIVMGTHGNTGFKHLFMGSQAERVVRRAPCDVLTVKPDGYDPKLDF